MDDVFHLLFAPEYWGEVRKFHRFYSKTYRFEDFQSAALEGVDRSFQKALALLEVAKLLETKLHEDLEELKTTSHSSQVNTSQFQAVADSIISALYATLDCTTKVLNAVFPKAQGLPDSTRKLFKNAKIGKLDQSIPPIIRDAYSQADWYTEIRVVRDALTHSNAGFCSYSEDGKIRYFHDALKCVYGKGYVDDFYVYIENHFTNVNEFLGKVYRGLNSTLKDDETWQGCGFYKSLLYSRYVRPSEAVNIHGGRCDAYIWFLEEDKPTCPLVSTCGAYKRVSPTAASPPAEPPPQP